MMSHFSRASNRISISDCIALPSFTFTVIIMMYIDVKTFLRSVQVWKVVEEGVALACISNRFNVRLSFMPSNSSLAWCLAVILLAKVRGGTVSVGQRKLHYGANAHWSPLCHTIYHAQVEYAAQLLNESINLSISLLWISWMCHLESTIINDYYFLRSPCFLVCWGTHNNYS